MIYINHKYNMYDFNTRNYVASYPLFGRPDPKCREFPWLNPYSFCGGDPISHTDPNGCEIRGHSKRDAELAVEDFKALFPGEKFASF